MFFNLVSVVLVILDFMFILAKRLCKPSKLWHKDDTFIWKKNCTNIEIIDIKIYYDIKISHYAFKQNKNKLKFKTVQLYTCFIISP